jgi:hypothetical protein
MQVEACSCPVTVVLLTTVRLSSSPCLVRWLALAFVRQGRVAAWWLAFAFVMQGMSAILLQASWFDQVWHHATVGQRPVPISLISRGGSRPVVSDLGMFLRCLNGLPLRCSVKLPIPCPSVQRPNPDPAKHPPPPPHDSLHGLAWQDINSIRCWGSSVALAVACRLRGMLGPAWSPRG